MKIGQSIKCPSCGASSVITQPQKPILECEYCGSMMSFQIDVGTQVNQTKPAKLTLLLVMLPLVVIVVMVIFWVVFQNIRVQTEVPQSNQQILIPKDTIEIPLTIQPNEKPKSSAELKNQLKITSQVKGETSLGGHYWIFSIVNNGKDEIGMPGVMVSLFNPDGKRVVEQAGYSFLTGLQPNEKSIVLVFVKELNETIAEMQTSMLASQPNIISGKQLKLTVSDYTLVEKNQRYEIIGDVVNNNEVKAKYTRVVAVAYDLKGNPIGTGNAFSTEKELLPNQTSGFKLSVATFLTGIPATWELWAVARP